MGNNCKAVLHNPLRALKYALSHYIPWLIKDDELYLKTCYLLATRRVLHLNNPQTFTEKLQWLKLHDRNPRYTQLVDKFEVKSYISGLIGDKYVIPTYGVWEDFEEIDFDKLPEQFVLKCTHDSGGLVICKDKAQLDLISAKTKISNSLRNNFYLEGREYQYKDVKPRIIAEKYLEQENGESLKDYKVLCFNGKAKLIEYHSDRFTSHHTQDFYDIKWNKTSISQGGKDSVSDYVVDAPKHLKEMINYSELITKEMAHCRVDWYEVGENLYFSEITFYDSSGFDRMDRDEDELMLGNWINIDKLK